MALLLLFARTLACLLCSHARLRPPACFFNLHLRLLCPPARLLVPSASSFTLPPLQKPPPPPVFGVASSPTSSARPPPPAFTASAASAAFSVAASSSQACLRRPHSSSAHPPGHPPRTLHSLPSARLFHSPAHLDYQPACPLPPFLCLITRPPLPPVRPPVRPTPPPPCLPYSPLRTGSKLSSQICTPTTEFRETPRQTTNKDFLNAFLSHFI